MDASERKKFLTKRRGENWNRQEKALLIGIMRQADPVIYSKQTDSDTNRQKTMEWLKVQKRLTSLSGKRRDMDQIKGFWKRLKMRTKTNNVKHKNKVTMIAENPQFNINEEEEINIFPVENNIKSDNIQNLLQNRENQPQRAKSSNNTANEDSTSNIKRRIMKLIEEAYSVKLMYQKKRLSHLESRQKIELDLLLLEKQKKTLEIKRLMKDFK